MKAKWIQTIIIFVEDTETFLLKEYERNWKIYKRFLILGSYNRLRYKKNSNGEIWYSNFKRLEKKTEKKQIIYYYFKDRYFNLILH